MYDKPKPLEKHHTAFLNKNTAREETSGVTEAEREDIILRYAPLIKIIANRLLMRMPPQIDISDIINSGIVGLIDAIDKFDTSKGVQFKTYAEFRIRGAILDNLRAMDWVPRSVRKNATRLEKAYAEIEKKLNRPGTDEEIAEALNIDLNQFYDLVAQASGISLLSLDMLSQHEDPRLKLIDCITDSESNPFFQVKQSEIQSIIARAIEQLPEKEKCIVSLYYYEDLTMKEISAVLDLTESRVSQLHTKAVIKLRVKLQEHLDLQGAD